MKPKGYLVFRLNLAFFSIEKESWADVIQTYHHQLLDLIEKTGIHCKEDGLQILEKLNQDY